MLSYGQISPLSRIFPHNPARSDLQSECNTSKHSDYKSERASEVLERASEVLERASEVLERASEVLERASEVLERASVALKTSKL